MQVIKRHESNKSTDCGRFAWKPWHQHTFALIASLNRACASSFILQPGLTKRAKDVAVHPDALLLHALRLEYMSTLKNCVCCYLDAVDLHLIIIIKTALCASQDTDTHNSTPLSTQNRTGSLLSLKVSSSLIIREQVGRSSESDGRRFEKKIGPPRSWFSSGAVS